MTTHPTYTFPHHRLDAWHISCQARRLTRTLLTDLPRGYADDARQLRRSSQAVPKLIAEGASRWARGDKRRRFEEAAGEIGETAAGIEELVDLGAVDPAQAHTALATWARCRATVIGLLRTLR
jgi:four helix bundle protein